MTNKELKKYSIELLEKENINKCVKCNKTVNLRKWGSFNCCDKCFSDVSTWAQEFDISSF